MKGMLRSNKNLTVLGSTTLGPGKSIVTIQVGGETLLLGVTASSINFNHKTGFY